MEVLILTPFFTPNIGGVETHLDDLVEILKDKPFKSYVLTYQPLMSSVTAPANEKKGNVEIQRVEWFRKLFYKFEPYPILDFLYLTPRLFIATFFFLLKHKDLKIIHAQGINAAFIAILLKPFFKTKVIISTHAVYEFQGETLFAKVTRWTFNRADKILSLLEHSKKELIKLGVKEEKIEPYCYWVDQQKFIPQDKQTAKMALNWDIAKLHVLFVGRLIEKKGVKELIEAARLLNEDCIVHIIGSGDLDDYVAQKSQEIKTLDYIGKIPNSELPSYFQAADIFIIPSTHEEGAGRVIMEALSCGTPVIGSNRGGIPEILDNEVGELIQVSSNDINKSVNIVRNKIKSNPDIQYNCREYAIQKFSFKNAETIINSYYS